MTISGGTKKRIDNMTHETMARIWRFSPSGDPLFVRGEAYDYFKKRFEELGGMTTAVSKAIGWDK